MLLRLVQIVIGVGLAIGLLVGGGYAAARYFMTRLTTLPARPSFSEEQVAGAPPASDGSQPGADALAESPTSPQPDPIDDADAYQARVIQPIGLILRQGPDTSTTQIGGIDYNEQLTVLSESEDGAWIQVRLPGSEVTGWVKAGNTEPLN
ncbi:MAG: SH3 domain-containing protein [Cyanobacteria bacterium P01_A01_bin.135]